MKEIKLSIMLTMLMSMVGTKSFAYDIAVENEDGVTIYYNYINNSTELAVTYYSHYNNNNKNAYSGNVVIPESVTILNRTRKVTSIGSYAFEYCSGLTSVTIPGSVTSIGKEAFSGCSGLKKVVVKDIAAWCSISFNDKAANPLFHTEHLYSDEDTEITDLVIPEGVTSIGAYAFYHCSGLTSVTIPNSVTSIGERAFYGCSGLKKVIVKDIAAWCSISFKDWDANPLNYARHLYSDEDTEITDLIIPDGVTSIGAYAFYHCSGLTSVTIPNSVTSIGERAFGYCSGLTSVTIPNSVTSIGYGAFFGCSGLTSVTIPNSVTSIGEYAFYDCDNLADFVSLIQEPFKVSYIVSGLVYDNGTLYVPEGTIDKYKATDGWKEFVWIEEGLPAGIKKTNNDDSNATEVQRYTIGGESINNPQHGINIIKMSDGTVKKVLIK